MVLAAIEFQLPVENHQKKHLMQNFGIDKTFELHELLYQVL